MAHEPAARIVDPSERLNSSRCTKDQPLKVGIDIGSKTIKVIVLDEEDKAIYSFYDRHLSSIKQTLQYAVKRTLPHCAGRLLTIGVSGSAGIQFAELMNLEFVQEVLASKLAIMRFIPKTDVAIELGGEDSKILFLSKGEELRMNNTCAGGTGGFIDTIAGMLNLNAEEFNSLALGCRTLYPIPSRCAVFAQSDVRPLLNEGVSHHDIAGSVFAAVATQCISGLACGRKIAGQVALLGGPFHFLSALRNAFQNALGEDGNEVETPPDAHLFVAKGAALFASESGLLTTLDDFKAQLEAIVWEPEQHNDLLAPLFDTPANYASFKERHESVKPQYGSLSSYEGRAYLGIDSGSTTIKCVLIGENNQFLFTHYQRVAGDLKEAAELMLRKLYKKLPRLHNGQPAVTIAHACVTGYGEDFFLKAFQADSGEVETIAHLRAAQQIVPDVDRILDIGGQDIKYLSVRNGVLQDIVLNEACSSGCGSLLSGFAYSMNVKVEEFTDAALFAKSPVDLGTRCSVFMTSRVRHAQKEGASTGDISAGLAYAIVRNALYKIIRVPNKEALGKSIVVQGGAFKSDAVLRAFELLCGSNVYRSGAAEYMGAFGAALLAKERSSFSDKAKTTLLNAEGLDGLVTKRSVVHCEKCTNHCMLTVCEFSESQDRKSLRQEERPNKFDAIVFEAEGLTPSWCPEKRNEKAPVRRLVVGNRCTRPLEHSKNEDTKPFNLFEYTKNRVFNYESLSLEKAKRGSIGILRALNTYDDYPLWHTFLTKLGFRVVLSDVSDRRIYERGIEAILSESACYPFKITNGHLLNLIDKGLHTIFFPYIEQGFEGKPHCSVLAKSPLVLGLNIEQLYAGKIRMLSPHLEYHDYEKTLTELYLLFADFDQSITKKETRDALDAGLAAYDSFRSDIKDAGRRGIQALQNTGKRGIVLGGRPYHHDPEIHHGLPELLNSFGLSVLTVESVDHLAKEPSHLYVDDVWETTSRMYRAAQFSSEYDLVDFIEIFSFGCGLDSVTVDQVQAILEAKGKPFMALKIDEMSDLAAARIRIRSLLAAQEKNNRKLTKSINSKTTISADPKVQNTSQMLVNWIPGYADAVKDGLRNSAEAVMVLPHEGVSTVSNGLSYSNNDICFSSLYAVGQVMTIAKRKKGIDLGESVAIPATCVGCRADDLPGLVRKALGDVDHLPVSMRLLNEFLDKAITEGCSYCKTEATKVADILLLLQLRDQVMLRLQSYIAQEKVEQFLEYANALIGQMYDENTFITLAALFLDRAEELLANDFMRKPLIALVGTAPALFNATINNKVVEQIKLEACEAVLPWYNDFLLYKLRSGNSRRDIEVIFETQAAKLAKVIKERAINEKTSFIQPPRTINYYRELALNSGLVSEYETVGVGWLYVGHVLDAMRNGVDSIAYVHPFGCLSAHTIGRGIFRKLREDNPNLDILSIEYDPGASGVNQNNRIKLLTSMAKRSEQKISKCLERLTINYENNPRKK